MTKHVRHVVAVTLVATALCADRMACAAPELPQPVVQFANRFAQRLGSGLKQKMPALRLLVRRQSPAMLVEACPPRQNLPISIQNNFLGPFELRLPPPLA